MKGNPNVNARGLTLFMLKMKKLLLYIALSVSISSAEEDMHTVDNGDLVLSPVGFHVKATEKAHIDGIFVDLEFLVKNDSNFVLFLSTPILRTDIRIDDLNVIQNKKNIEFFLVAEGMPESYVSRSYLMLDVNRYRNIKGYPQARSDGSAREVAFNFKLSDYLRVFLGESEDGSGRANFSRELSVYESISVKGKAKIVIYDATKDIGFIKMAPFALKFKIDSKGNVTMLD